MFRWMSVVPPPIVYAKDCRYGPVHTPSPSTGPVYDELSARFRQAFKQTKPLFHDLYAARRLIRG